MTQLLPPLLRVLRASSATSSAADEYLYFWRWQLRRMGGLLALLALLSSALRPRKLRTRGAPRRRRPASNGAAEDPGAPRARYRSIAPPSSPAAAAAARRTLRAAMARRRVRRAALKDDQPLSIGEGDFDTAAEATGDHESGGSAEEGGSPLRVHGGLEVAVSCPTPSVLSSSPPHSTQDGSPERGQRCEADEEGSTAGGTVPAAFTPPSRPETNVLIELQPQLPSPQRVKYRGACEQETERPASARRASRRGGDGNRASAAPCVSQEVEVSVVPSPPQRTRSGRLSSGPQPYWARGGVDYTGTFRSEYSTTTRVRPRKSDHAN